MKKRVYRPKLAAVVDADGDVSVWLNFSGLHTSGHGETLSDALFRLSLVVGRAQQAGWDSKAAITAKPKGE